MPTIMPSSSDVDLPLPMHAPGRAAPVLSRRAMVGTTLCAVLVGIAIRLGSPDVSHLPPLLRPHRPTAIALINGMGGVLIRAGAIKLPSPDAAVASACRAARLPPGASCELDLPGDDGADWREGLRTVLASYEADARLTALGHLIARGQTEQWLVTRIRLVHAWRALPEGALAAVEVARPIFIVGLPRTGTTFLLNLLMQDPRLRAPLHWELVAPISAHGEPAAGSDHHVRAIEHKLAQYQALLPGFDEMHPMEAAMAEECTVTMALEFSSLLFEATFDVSSYVAWLLRRAAPAGAGGQPGYARVLTFHRRVLQHLQLAERPEAAAARGRRHWVLKSPWFLHTLDAIAAEYPDARIIHTHRAPATVVGSSASMHAKTFGAGSDAIDLRRIGEQQLNITQAMVAAGMEARARWRSDRPELARRVSDLQLDALKSDPIGAVETVYSQLGMELSDEAREGMQRWLRKEQVRHGKHVVHLADFGLSAERIMQGSEVFRRYCREYDVRGCEP